MGQHIVGALPQDIDEQNPPLRDIHPVVPPLLKRGLGRCRLWLGLVVRFANQPQRRGCYTRRRSGRTSFALYRTVCHHTTSSLPVKVVMSVTRQCGHGLQIMRCNCMGLVGQLSRIGPNFVVAGQVN
jgi:hypothetical protein